MPNKGRRCFAIFLVFAIVYLIISGISTHINKGKLQSEVAENAQWVASSRHWIDKQACNWFGLCGIFHLNSAKWTWKTADIGVPPTVPDFSGYWKSSAEDPDSWTDEERSKREIPQYVLDHAPYVHLFSEEKFWPCDLAEHIAHISPRMNYTKLLELEHDANLTNLHELNEVHHGGSGGRFVYLQSDDNVEAGPKWLYGAHNIPTSAKVENDGDLEAPWPDPENDLSAQKLTPGQQQRLDDFKESLDISRAEDETSPKPVLTPSWDGRCGGNTGFTCEGSSFGKCCSIYGWCGKSDDFCGTACDATSGRCNDPFEPYPRPKSELRRRMLEIKSAKELPEPAGKSSAPAILIVVPKDDGIVDAFWFFFYSFNLGQSVLNIRFGNHVGDWEHTLIRFKDGKPVAAFLSEHDFGDAYHWHALEKYIQSVDGSGTMIGTWSNGTAAKIAKRPVVYSAVGTHAMYAKPGLHPYVLPWGMLHDITDRGPLWDPALNVRSFTWNFDDQVVRASTRNPKAPTGWFDFGGHWGDKFYPLSDPRQYRLAGQYHYVNGPTGPKFKNLQRSKVCQGRIACHIRDWLASGSRATRLQPVEEEVEEGGLPGGNSTSDGESCAMR